MTRFSRSLRHRFFDTLQGIRGGRLTLTTPELDVLHFGEEGPEADIQIHDWSVIGMLAARGNVGLGEAWVEGLWTTSSLESLLTLALRNAGQLVRWDEPGMLSRTKMALLNRFVRLNSLRGSSRNIRAHYDIGNEFFQLWLDPGMTYSSALFASGDDLIAAQARKNARIMSKLGKGERILEIGCGWGGFAEAAAESGRHVTGITLSPSQKGYADARLDGRAEIRLQDYREVRGRFDNIVSIEMIEAVGERYWPSYFKTLRERLAEGGHAMVQSIVVNDSDFPTYRKQSDFIREHIFPGGMLPCVSVIQQEAARAGLRVNEVYSFGSHYAQTCRLWAERLTLQSARIMRFGYDNRFLRSWQFYLESCAATFAAGRTNVVQVDLVHAAG
ncbi:MAG: cyclopropane-fatty-acyl-phospholipid synthase family protein [Xanthobacteraceae bacterium]